MTKELHSLKHRFLVLITQAVVTVVSLVREDLSKYIPTLDMVFERGQKLTLFPKNDLFRAFVASRATHPKIGVCTLKAFVVYKHGKGVTPKREYRRPIADDFRL
ncbi:uncharacterized protein LOC141719399 [Apium graveolens]|uniref:uncharacterized protein LOC141719399 n=1 Tax=Apium graveolens TaxID=4045 RepID=UPI003D7A82EC